MKNFFILCFPALVIGIPAGLLFGGYAGIEKLDFPGVLLFWLIFFISSYVHFVRFRYLMPSPIKMKRQSESIGVFNRLIERFIYWAIISRLRRAVFFLLLVFLFVYLAHSFLGGGEKVNCREISRRCETGKLIVQALNINPTAGLAIMLVPAGLVSNFFLWTLEGFIPGRRDKLQERVNFSLNYDE